MAWYKVVTMDAIDGKLVYDYNGRETTLAFNTAAECRGSGVRIEPEAVRQRGSSRYVINIVPESSITIRELFLTLKNIYDPEDRIFVNGYESWTDSRERGVNDSIKPLDSSLLSTYLAYQGDYTFYSYTGEAGTLHSFSYTYIKSRDGICRFIGSMAEHTGFTVFEHRTHENVLLIRKDCGDLYIDGEYRGIDILLERGCEQEVFDDYFKFLGTKRARTQPCTGWTSWYYYYNNISEDIIMQNMDALSTRNIPIDIFQIDDGYQQVVGDWTRVNAKFPRGMKYIAQNIKKRGYKAGLWLAPFLGGRASAMCGNHPEWAVCDDGGQPIRIGSSTAWGGDYYAMDIYNDGFRDYLTDTFNTILQDWGFDLVKLDFLYAACIFPRKDKTRGRIMADAMKFLRKITGDRLILGCGVPLASSFGLVDYCRIGCDVSLRWEDETYGRLNFRERNSTSNSLVSTIGRWHLNKHAFLNDPDVFILRSANNELSKEQRYTLTLLNNIFGGLCFTSDNLDEYSAPEMNLYRSLFPMKLKDIRQVSSDGDFVEIRFSIGDKDYLALSNLGGGELKKEIPKGLYYSSKTGDLSFGGVVELMPYESVCFLTAHRRDYEIIGSEGHIFPGSEVDGFTAKDGCINIAVDNKSLNRGHILIKIPDDIGGCSVNGEYVKACKHDGLNILKF